MFLARIKQTVLRHHMFRPGQCIGVAVSGGADSVCLLRILLDLALEWTLQLKVLHLDHGLRGAESRADAEYVRALASSLGLAVIIRTIALDTAGNLEQAGRDARLAFFRQTLASGEVDRIALGHTRNDQAETVLFRFLRGAGTAGLAGARPATELGIVRPLIDVTRAEVEAYLRERGIAWRDDSTNRSPEFARNRIRHQLLPQLEREWNPAIIDTLANTADWALAEEEYWERELDAIETAEVGPPERDGAVILRAATLRALPLAAARRLVRRAMGRVKGNLRSINFGHVNAVMELAASWSGHGRIQLPGVEVRRSFDTLRFGKPLRRNSGYELPAEVPGVLSVPGTGITLCMELITARETSHPGDSVYNKETGLDWRLLAGPLHLRNWRPGDQYQPRGSAGEKKLKTLFQEARIPVWERHHWPILMHGSSIIWARRFGPAAEFSVRPDSTAVLVIREQAESVMGDTASIEL